MLPQTYLEISSQAFDHNINYYKNLIGHNNAFAAVIKGNGYGHGLHEIADLCQHNRFVDMICVAQLSEALALCNITKPILVLGYSDVNPEHAVRKNIHFMVDNVEYAHKLNDIGYQHSYRFNVHVKIDTGLSRMGISTHEAVDFIKQLATLDNLYIAGIYSHFAASDSNPAFTEHQLTQCVNVLTSLGNAMDIAYIHMSNTAAINTIAYPAVFNCFRIGLGIYGLGSNLSHLKPVMIWKTHITNIKTVPANSYVSYAGTYQTERTTRIALLPIGYFDGYDFRFSNKASVIIHGSYAPVIGRIAMNVTIVDITDITAHTGDEVIVIGSHPGIGAHDLAHLAEIKNVREIITGINPAIKRIITL